MKTFRIILLCVPLLLAACKGKTTGDSISDEKTTTEIIIDDSATEIPESMDELTSNFMGTFSGILPCADCEGILTTLTLNADGTYILETIYQGKGDDNKFTDQGKWIPSDDFTFIKLIDKNENNSYYAPVNRNTFEKLDTNAQPIISEFNYKLIRK